MTPATWARAEALLVSLVSVLEQLSEDENGSTASRVLASGLATIFANCAGGIEHHAAIEALSPRQENQDVTH